MAITYGIQQGYLAARRAFEDPTDLYRQQTMSERINMYALLWSYYNNSIFDKSSPAWNIWAAYKSTYTLYRNIRSLYNPTRRLVDFYAGSIYPGVLAIDGKPLPDGVPSAVPFGADTPPALSAAIGQLWQWDNWQSKKAVLVRYSAALGSVLVEVVDDLEHGKVTSNICWPGFITDLELDSAGNVKGYTIQYSTSDENGLYTFRKEVDGDSFRYFRDGQPYAYDEQAGAVVPNLYGFVPAIWIKHVDTGSDTGSPAVAGSLGKIDELNNLASHLHDHVHKVIGSPSVLWGGAGMKNLFNTPKRGATEEFVQPTADQESVLMLTGPAGGRVDPLYGNLNIAEALNALHDLLGEIEQDHPELVYYRELRSMSQVTGPAASRLVGDVTSRVAEAAAMYDQQCIKLFQMAVAIGGYRASSGDWGSLNRQQQKFRPFSLDSYEAGDLDFSILPRPLMTPTKLEISQEKQAMWQGVALAVQAGAPLEAVLRDEGWTDEELATLGQDQINAIQRQQTLAMQDIVPTVAQ